LSDGFQEKSKISHQLFYSKQRGSREQQEYEQRGGGGPAGQAAKGAAGRAAGGKEKQEIEEEQNAQILDIEHAGAIPSQNLEPGVSQHS